MLCCRALLEGRRPGWVSWLDIYDTFDGKLLRIWKKTENVSRHEGDWAGPCTQLGSACQRHHQHGTACLFIEY